MSETRFTAAAVTQKSECFVSFKIFSNVVQLVVSHLDPSLRRSESLLIFKNNILLHSEHFKSFWNLLKLSELLFGMRFEVPINFYLLKKK
jgi:hypothetical protein